MIDAGDHPKAIPSSKCPYIYCINTTSNMIPVIGKTTMLYFTDYDESSDLSVIQEAKSAASFVLNGIDDVDTITDFSLGLDPTVFILLQSGNISLLNIQIGNILKDGSEVLGIIVEECSHCVQTPAGIIMSASQLIYHDNRWVRAHKIFPTLPGTQRLIQLMLSDNQPITITNHTETWLARDYMEVHDLSVQEPYNRYLKLE
jgi:hypothetical protein